MYLTELKFDRQSLITPELVKEHAWVPETNLDERLLVEKKAELALVLELARQGFARGDAAAAIVSRLAASLHSLRRSSGPDVWKQLIPIAQAHPLSQYLQQDPFTRWSFDKPRGYSGDAGLLDIIYKHSSADGVVADSTDLGKEIFDYTGDAETSVAARERREILARSVDEAADRVAMPEVLAVACGHLREAALSTALAAGKVGRWVALDQDPDSVNEVRESLAGTAVEGVIGNVSGLMRRSYKLGNFDLVYASGLYDYLPRAVAVRLTQRLLELVKPGGEYLFANYSDEITTDGYMETFMDWPLLLRNADDILDIINAAVDRNKVSVEVFYGDNRNIVYGRIRRLAD